MDTRNPQSERRSILVLSIVLFVVSCVAAFLGMYVTSVPRDVVCHIDVWQVPVGLVLTIPLFAGLIAIRTSHRPVIRELWDLPVELLGPGLARTSLFELVLIAAMAGIGEELLFRGFLQHWLVAYGLPAGLILPSVLFGLLHSLSTAYAVGAFIVGLYFASVLQFVPGVGVTAVIVAHAMYDLVALHCVRASARRSQVA